MGSYSSIMLKERVHAAATSRRFPHYLLLGVLIGEFIELENAEFGVAHHAWDALVIILFAYSGARINGRRQTFAWLLTLGVIPWTIDTLGLSWHALDVESIFWAIFHGCLGFAIVRSLFRRVDDISDTEIAGAVSFYLLAGFGFANLYALIMSRIPGALTWSSNPGAGSIPYDMVVYYSFITQATVGYGDMSPAHPVTRTISVIQALFGVIYLAVLIARLVSIHAARQMGLHAQKLISQRQAAEFPSLPTTPTGREPPPPVDESAFQVPRG